MGFFEKVGLVERTATETPVAMELPLEPVVTAAVDIDCTQGIVETIYEQNGLQDTSNSIYTVRALIDTLPAEMTTVKKQATVAGILAVSGKPLPELLADAARRKDILMAAQTRIAEERTQEINGAKADIEELKRLIEAANIRIKTAEEILDATKESVDKELGAIGELVEFCQGMGEKP